MKYILLVLSLVLSPMLLHAQPADNPSDPHQDLIAGMQLNAAGAANLEAEVAKNPDNLSARGKLLGYYFTKRLNSKEAKENTQKHICWIITNCPEAEIAGIPDCQVDAILDPDGYDQAKQLWLAQVLAHPQNALVLSHAAHFFLLPDKNIAQDLLKKAETVEPNNPQWSDQLAQLYVLQHSKDAAVKALLEFQKAQAVDPDEMSRFYRLDSLVKTAFDAEQKELASHFAHELLKAADKYPTDWNHGNAVHHANNVLGRIALRDGKVKQAGEYLLKAGQTSGSPQLNSFGPNMSLAKELLEKEEKETVLQYFELCRKFWNSGGQRLDTWTKEVNAGKVPEFGANLVY